MSASFAALEHEPLGRAGDEVGHDRVHRDAPALDHDAGLAGGDEARPHARVVELPGELQLRGHLADVAVGADREDHQRIHRLRQPRGDRQVGRRAAEIQDLPSLGPRLLGEQWIVAEKGVETAPEIAAVIERLGQPRAPLRRHPPALGRDADQDRGRAEGEPLAHGADDRDLAAKAQDVLHGLPGLLSVEHAHRAVWQVADHRVGRLGGHGREVAVGDDQEARSSHPVRCAKVGRKARPWPARFRRARPPRPDRRRPRRAGYGGPGPSPAP